LVSFSTAERLLELIIAIRASAGSKTQMVWLTGTGHPALDGK
jgi:hypothetical protein